MRLPLVRLLRSFEVSRTFSDSREEFMSLCCATSKAEYAESISCCYSLVTVLDLADTATTVKGSSLFEYMVSICDVEIGTMMFDGYSEELRE